MAEATIEAECMYCGKTWQVQPWHTDLSCSKCKETKLIRFRKTSEKIDFYKDDRKREEEKNETEEKELEDTFNRLVSSED